MSTVFIRQLETADLPQIQVLFQETITTVNRQHYSETQVQVWGNPKRRNWQAAALSRTTLVAELASVIVGFAELEPNGHIDCFYVHKDYQGQGVGSQLYRQLETTAQRCGLRELWLEASLTALPFFLRQGFTDLGAQTVYLAGVEFINHRLHKSLELL